MIIYNKYTNLRDHTWYDSSNVVYSECIDTDKPEKTLKIVYKQGRTYLYRDVNVDDYILFKNAESNGKAFNQYIKKYECVRLPDTPLEELDKKMKEFQQDDSEAAEVFGNLQYTLSINETNGEFTLSLNGKDIFSGIENQVSIIRLLKCMNIAYMLVDKTNDSGNEENGDV